MVGEEARLKRKEDSLTRYENFLKGEHEGDVTRMKVMMGEVKASDPQCEWLPDMELKLALRSKDWEGLKRGLESMPASEAKESAVRELARDFVVKEAGWEGAPAEVMAVFAKAVEEAWKSREKEGSNPVAGDYLVLCRMYWKAGDKKAAVERVRMAGKLVEDSKVGPYTVMVRRFVESVEAGRLPTHQEVGEWGSEAE